MVQRVAAGLRWLFQLKLIKHNVQVQPFSRTSHTLQVLQSQGASGHHTGQQRWRTCPESPTGSAGVDRSTRSGFESQLRPSELRLPGPGPRVCAARAPVCGVRTIPSSWVGCQDSTRHSPRAPPRVSALKVLSSSRSPKRHSGASLRPRNPRGTSVS